MLRFKKWFSGTIKILWMNIYPWTSGRLARHPGLGAAPTLARGTQRQISTIRLGRIIVPIHGCGVMECKRGKEVEKITVFDGVSNVLCTK